MSKPSPFFRIDFDKFNVVAMTLEPLEPTTLTKLKRKSPLVQAPTPQRVKAPKMGRPRRAGKLRVSRGVRLDPVLIERADKFVGREDYPQISNFTDIVEVSLREWLERNESGTRVSVKKRA